MHWRNKQPPNDTNTTHSSHPSKQATTLWEKASQEVARLRAGNCGVVVCVFQV